MASEPAGAKGGMDQGAVLSPRLNGVDIAEELVRRPRRSRDQAAEERALAALAREMAENPRNILQRLAEATLESCRADTAGISLLQGDVFRWEAIAGVLSGYRNGTMPRHASPCGLCLDRERTQLMHLPDRCFPALKAEPRFVEVLLVPFRVRGKSIGAVWIVSHDFDKEFDGEDERMVTELTQFASAGWQLWKTCEAAEAASRRKEEFLAILGHELRNPIAAIVHATGALRQTFAARDSSDSVDIIARQAASMARLVEDLLDVARISQGRLEVRKAPIALQSVLVHALECVRPSIERRRHQLVTDVPHEPIWIDGDALRLEQIVSNLLDNAAKFTPDGGQIRLSLRCDANQAMLTVRDDGIGIASDKVDAIFELFEQIEVDRSSRPSGLGLGLTLVRRLAELHGGSVHAASDGLGRGSRFTVHLPRLSLSSTQAESAPDPRTSSAARRASLAEDHQDAGRGAWLNPVRDGHGARSSIDAQ